MSNKKVVVLVGSPKEKGSTSESLGVYLTDCLKEKNWESEFIRVKDIVLAEERKSCMTLIDNCDVLVFSFPLYADCLPAIAIEALEIISEHRKECSKQRPSFMAIANSGFPEAHQNNVALRICRQFAKEAQFNWVGGLSLGGGAVIDGKPLQEMNWYTKRTRKALSKTALALNKGDCVPEEAIKLMAKILIPSWLYAKMSKYVSRHLAKKFNVLEKWYDKPYQ